MADEVPVSDVLCEAMEYLSKLGSNLRSRSENLKEKRINKDKLKNSHAVQKAASKVLLICELSKKSLDNVETGVRKVLSLVDKSQSASSSIGAKTSGDKYRSSILKKYYFEYNSRKLRISKKIPVKHYLSVKVLARRMTNSILEKYPVYHDCKLYRSRKKILELKNSKDNAEKCITRKISIDKSDTERVSNKKEMNAVTQTTQLNEANESTITCGQNDKSYKEVTNNGSMQNNIAVIDKDSENVTMNQKIENQKNDVVKNKAEDEKTDKSVHISDGQSYVIDSDNDSITSVKHNKNTGTDYHEDSKKRSKKHDDRQKRFKHLIIPQDSSDEEDKGIQINSPEQGKTLSSDNSDNGSNSLSSELKMSSAQNDLADQDESDTIVTEKDNAEREETDETASEKPLIRCVNISKLLKPDVIDKNTGKNVKTGTINNSELSIRKKRKEHIKEQSDKKKDSKIRSQVKNTCNISEDYWTQKRIEIRSFKSKEFSVNITRLPKLSEKLLRAHSLMRITHAGDILCESEEQNKRNSKKSVEDLSEVKSALLNDSESDNETALPVAVASKNVKDCPTIDAHLANNTFVRNNSHSSDKTTKVSDAHLIDSVSDKECNERETSVINKGSDSNKEYSPTKIKHALLNESDSDKDEGLDEGKHMKKAIQSSEKNNVIDNIKDALLNDSESDVSEEQAIKDKNKKQGNQDKNEDDEGHQFTKEEFKEFEKKVTEIIKSSLLTDSDCDKSMKNKTAVENGSDDSENDEQQNNDTTNECNIVSNEESNEKDSDKPSSSKDPESVKSALLQDSSDNASASGESSKREKKLKLRKHDEESVNAKNKLLNHSSSSDAENEGSQGSSNEDISKKSKRKHRKKLLRRLTSSSSSNDDDIMNPKKKLKLDPKTSENNQSEDSDNDNSSNTTKSQTKQIDGAVDKETSRKMVRSKAKPCGSSGHSSDNQDDKDIDGLANLNSLNKSHRRRESSSTTSTNNTQDTSSKQQGRSKPSIIGEDLLHPESSSDSISDNGQDNSDVEELPPVPVTGLNGDSVDHLAKDDLLHDSDSSGSHDKDKDEDVPNADDSEEENNVKLKRRKANAISSDSEVGSSRRKDRDVRLSDFEDSEDSEAAKKSKRKKGSDSDGSGNSSDAGKKKRRRIKQLNESDDGSGSDTETEGRNKHGRKNIRKVMGKNQLEEATKKAAREEKERIARITERQKLYNNVEFDESGKPDEVVLEKVVLDFDPETKEPLIEVDRGLVKKLKPHQANGIKFMWNACFESVKRIKKDKGSGCILAHCMGLGKTLQVISLAHTLLTQSRLTGVRRVLVVCPLSTVLNWVGEVRMWLEYAHSDYQLDVYELSRYKQNSERAYQLQQWLDGGGVCVLGYEMFRNLSADNSKKYKKKILKSFQESLVDPGPDLVVCDEGHLLKNEKTSLSQSMNRVKTRRRIVLTGTPLQNNLKEYYCMVQFVKPNLLGKYNEYLNRFVNPITNGQYTDSTEHDIRVMKRRSHVLHKMLDGAVQRRDYGVLAPFLPPKHEYVLFITLTDVQIKLYQHYLDNYSRRPMPGKSSGFLFPDFQSLQRIWTHPLVLKYNSERYEIMQQKKRDREEEDSEGSLVDFIDDDSTPDESSTEDSSDDLSDMSDDSRKKSKKKKAAKKGKGRETKVTTRRGTRANPVEIDEEDVPMAEMVEVRTENPTEWWVPLLADDELADLRHSHKLVLLFDILRQCEAIGDKLLVFSQSLYSLDLIEHFLDKVDQATQEGRIDEKLGGHVGTWSPGVDYFRLDGSTSCENRSIWCKNFNREDNPRARLFLISTRAGGLGINLVAANRVVIFDVSWNPSHDVQSIFRVYRFGQKKPCYVYRFLAMGTMEEKIYERQVTKQAISKRVIDEQQIDRHYAENDLAELYTFQPRPPAPRALPTLPKDRLFAEMLKEHDVQIYKYHEHDSLLENKEEETLSEEERKAAWEDFENEKSRPPPAPFPNAWPLHNGMVPGLLAHQQQQLALVALSSMLRKDIPGITDNQIREMVPHIFNTNPGLMQKMGEIYKYAQPGMMNPGIMNPAMNPGGGGGGAGSMGGTSGLQYEPPWQRQHQQQQQMRLQQLLQQQNQMGAKFYAGGLGSRDPVAMALQQQRAREIMLSGGGTAGPGGGGGATAGRPRGRPPLQPRAPPALLAPPGDVVDLDSD